jgi:DNA-binding MarR family transcriptional regulator
MKVDDIYKQPGHLIRRAYQMVMAVFAEETKGFGITPVQFSALIVIREQPGIDATRVAELIYFDRATIGNVLDRLETKGFIQREAGKQDRRTKRLFITPRGMALVKKIERLTPRISNRVVAPLAPADRAKLMTMLNQLVDLDYSESRAPNGIYELRRRAK